jgi:hypothetical protein
MGDIDYIGADELVFNANKELGVYSGGFSVDSVMLKAGLSPIMTINNSIQTGGTDKVSDLFQDLVIPNWALSYNNKIIGGEYKDSDSDSDSDSDIDDDLHDKLIGLVKEHESKLAEGGTKNTTGRALGKRKTRKRSLINGKKKGTKKYRD